jgi:hypothetical protein
MIICVYFVCCRPLSELSRPILLSSEAIKVLNRWHNVRWTHSSLKPCFVWYTVRKFLLLWISYELGAPGGSTEGSPRRVLLQTWHSGSSPQPELTPTATCYNLILKYFAKTREGKFLSPPTHNHSPLLPNPKQSLTHSQNLNQHRMSIYTWACTQLHIQWT